MNKTELTKVVAEKAELTQKDAAAATQAVLDTITTALANEEKVQILGFGTFEGAGCCSITSAV
ncbi:DNA-binding protein HU (plasmid) [Bacillus cereus FRI-35]|nr:DNA-binding protein HU [Bacillus cereus FRI-35]